MEVPHILEADTVNDIYDTIYGKSLSPTMRRSVLMMTIPTTSMLMVEELTEDKRDDSAFMRKCIEYNKEQMELYTKTETDSSIGRNRTTAL